jgi:hypothetical protein
MPGEPMQNPKKLNSNNSLSLLQERKILYPGQKFLVSGRQITEILTILAVILMLSGCSGLLNYDKAHLKKEYIHKESPVVYIYPFNNVYSQASIGVLPFQVPANMTTHQGKGVASIFQEIMLSKGVYRQVQRIDKAYGNLDEAIKIGKNAKVDLVLAGVINYALEGGEFGGAKVDLSIRLLNVNTRNTVWYMEQTIIQEMEYPKNDFMTRLASSFSPLEIKRPANTSYVPNMIARIASDMTSVIGGEKNIEKRMKN